MYISKRTAVLVVVILVAIAAIWIGLSRRGGERADAASANPGNDAPSAAVATVRVRPAVSSITVPGVFQAYQDVLIHAKVSGYIKQIFVDIGDRVHTGEVLAILEVPELNAQVDSAKAAVQRDQSEIQRTSHDVSRAMAIHAALHTEYARLKRQPHRCRDWWRSRKSTTSKRPICRRRRRSTEPSRRMRRRRQR